jgi:GT2 family glycosyltransferase
LEENRGAAARTVGVELAKTRFVAFCDDDSWWAHGALPQALSAMKRHPSIALVAARVLVGHDERPDPTSLRMGSSRLEVLPSLPGTRVLGFVACAVVCRRDAYLECGGFHPRYGVGGEEALLAIDLAARGYASIYLEDVVAHHHPYRSGDGPESGERRSTTSRNDCWTAWLRLPWKHAAIRTMEVARCDGGLRGLLRALRGAPWIMRERHAVPRSVASAFLSTSPKQEDA